MQLFALFWPRFCNVSSINFQVKVNEAPGAKFGLFFGFKVKTYSFMAIRKVSHVYGGVTLLQPPLLMPTGEDDLTCSEKLHGGL